MDELMRKFATLLQVTIGVVIVLIILITGYVNASQDTS